MSFSVWSRLRRGWSAVVAAAVGLGACGGDGLDGKGPDWFAIGDASLDARVLEGGLRFDAQPGTGGVPPFNELCGVSLCPDGLSPDNPRACESYDGGAFGPASGGGVGAGGNGGSGGTGGVPTEAGEYAPDASEDGGPDASTDGSADGSVVDAARDSASNDAANASSAADARPDRGQDSEGGADAVPGDAGAPSTFPELVFACHVHVDEQRGVVHRCDLAGRGGVDAACTSSRDCQPGLACVGDENAGRCLEFCCVRECPTGTYCTERPLRLQYSVPATPLVPVCAPADDCILDEPYGCDPTTGQACSCPLGTTCSIVRDDGTTACIEPGNGLNGDPCEAANQCAAGYFCSPANTCLKICRTGLEGAQCEQGRCQAAANFPEGMGLCVGLPLGR